MVMCQRKLVAVGGFQSVSSNATDEQLAESLNVFIRRNTSLLSSVLFPKFCTNFVFSLHFLFFLCLGYEKVGKTDICYIKAQFTIKPKPKLYFE